MSIAASRRGFLAAGVAAAASGVVSAAGRMARPAATASPTRIRRSALELPANDPVFAKYADAVKRMHALPETDGRNWRRQARIHADYCKHGIDEFLPWHRHYLNQFEQICGQLIGDATFALPYWDWTFGKGIVPDPFYNDPLLNVVDLNDPGVYSSPNWGPINTQPARGLAKGAGVQDDPVRGGAFTGANISNILRLSDFGNFRSRLEGSPHNSGHVVVGNSNSPVVVRGHMGSGLSPLDPIFWLHHCNVDRLWAQWQLAGNTTPDFPQVYNANFFDKDGRSIDVAAQDAIDFDALGYSYQQFADPRRLLAAAGVASIAADRPMRGVLKSRREAASIQPATLGESKAAVKIEVNSAATIPVGVKDLLNSLAATRPAVDASLPASRSVDSKEAAFFGRKLQSRRRILARLSGVRTTSASPPFINVFIDCPYLDSHTPYTDQHFADSVCLFGSHGSADHGPGGKAHDFVVDLTSALANANLADPNSVRLQLVPVGADAGEVSVESIRIFAE